MNRIFSDLADSVRKEACLWVFDVWWFFVSTGRALEEQGPWVRRKGNSFAPSRTLPTPYRIHTARDSINRFPIIGVCTQLP